LCTSIQTTDSSSEEEIIPAKAKEKKKSTKAQAGNKATKCHLEEMTGQEDSEDPAWINPFVHSLQSIEIDTYVGQWGIQ
jgi:hypothetical protein